MGRIKSEILEGKLVIRSKPNIHGIAAISLVFTLNGVAVPRSTGVRIPVSEWDAGKERIKSTYPDAARLNNYLRHLKHQMSERIEKFTGTFTARPKIVLLVFLEE